MVRLSLRHAGPLLVMTLICSCGDPSSAPSTIGPSVAGTIAPSTAPSATAAQPAISDALPATTLLVMPTRNDALVASVEPTQVTEPCPVSTGGPDGTAAMQTELVRLEPMLGIVLAYGGQHPEEFGSYGLIWQGTNDGSVFISFTADLALHREALNNLVEYPDELIVCQVAVPGDVARALMVKLTDHLQGRFY
jgi:hypothetical protein